MKTMPMGAEIDQMWDEVLVVTRLVVPTFMLGTCATMATALFLALRGVLTVLRHPLRPVDRFRDFHLPKNFGLGFIVMMAMAWVFGTLGWGNMDALLYNVFAPAAVLLLIQSLAVVTTFVWTKMPAPVAGMLVGASAILMLILVHPFIMIGLLDLHFDFRKRITRVGQED